MLPPSTIDALAGAIGALRVGEDAVAVRHGGARAGSEARSARAPAGDVPHAEVTT